MVNYISHLYVIEKEKFALDRKRTIEYRDSFHPMDVRKDCLKLDIRIKIESDSIISKKEIFLK